MSEPTKPAAPRVLRVLEGLGICDPRPALGAPERAAGPARVERVFSVTVAGTVPEDDLSCVATAEDPRTRVGIPAPGTPHPREKAWTARPPEIHPVGVRERGGAMIARRSGFYNVRVRYARAGRGN